MTALDLKTERMNRGLSLDAMATQIGISPTTLHRVELGVAEPNPANKKKIADFLGKKVTDIWPVEAPASEAIA